MGPRCAGRLGQPGQGRSEPVDLAAVRGASSGLLEVRPDAGQPDPGAGPQAGGDRSEPVGVQAGPAEAGLDVEMEAQCPPRPAGATPGGSGGLDDPTERVLARGADGDVEPHRRGDDRRRHGVEAEQRRPDAARPQLDGLVEGGDGEAVAPAASSASPTGTAPWP